MNNLPKLIINEIAKKLDNLSLVRLSTTCKKIYNKIDWYYVAGKTRKEFVLDFCSEAEIYNDLISKFAVRIKNPIWSMYTLYGSKPLRKFVWNNALVAIRGLNDLKLVCYNANAVNIIYIKDCNNLRRIDSYAGDIIPELKAHSHNVYPAEFVNFLTAKHDGFDHVRKEHFVSIESIISVFYIINNPKLSEVNVPQNIIHLDLRYNNIKSIDNWIDLPHVVFINLKGNKIERINKLIKMPQLCVWILKNNPLKKIRSIKYYKNLVQLDLSGTRIKKIRAPNSRCKIIL